MNRRNFIHSAAFAGLAAAPGSAAGRNAYYELRYYLLRNGDQLKRTSDFLGSAFAPAARRAGLGPLGFFNAVIAQESPFVLALISYPSLDAIERSRGALSADKEFQKGWDAFNSMSDLSYIRMECSLLRAFDGAPAITVPPSSNRRAPRIFELRTYESKNQRAGQRKIGMFDEAEAGIFRRLGMLPVFFGETIFGTRMPSLTYMLSYDDLAARDKLWGAFGRDPEWQKLRARPELADAEIVSNISNSILRPLPFSEIR